MASWGIGAGATVVVVSTGGATATESAGTTAVSLGVVAVGLRLDRHGRIRDAVAVGVVEDIAGRCSCFVERLANLVLDDVCRCQADAGEDGECSHHHAADQQRVADAGGG